MKADVAWTDRICYVFTTQYSPCYIFQRQESFCGC